MSRKAAQLAAIITNPLNVHNFVCIIEGFSTEKALIIESTTFPTEKFREITLWIQGEKVIFPTLPESENRWKFKIPESDSVTVHRDLTAIKGSMYNQKTGRFTPTRFKSIEVIARDLADNNLFSVRMHGAWLKGRDSASLANNNPSESWKWDYEWVYDWIEDIIQPEIATTNPYV